MDSLLLILGLFLISSIVIGYIGFIEMDFIIGVKSFSNPYFYIGLSFIEHTTTDPEYIEQELIIGLFLFNITIVFYKEKN